jgi:hypothetical protein
MLSWERAEVVKTRVYFGRLYHAWQPHRLLSQAALAVDEAHLPRVCVGGGWGGDVNVRVFGLWILHTAVVTGRGDKTKSFGG